MRVLNLGVCTKNLIMLLIMLLKIRKLWKILIKIEDLEVVIELKKKTWKRE